jgi:predicted TIM-barrel fold metal-dependent hydrolase
VLFASNWAFYFQLSDDVLTRVVAEMWVLSLKDEVRKTWLYRNAARLFQREERLDLPQGGANASQFN